MAGRPGAIDIVDPKEEATLKRAFYCSLDRVKNKRFFLFRLYSCERGGGRLKLRVLHRPTSLSTLPNLFLCLCFTVVQRGSEESNHTEITLARYALLMLYSSSKRFGRVERCGSTLPNLFYCTSISKLLQSTPVH